MATLVILALAILSISASALGNGEDLKTQERLFLNSLGLSARPKPSEHRRVPSVLWRMFKRTSTRENDTHERDPCMVSEYGVRGNIVRFVQDQGELYPYVSPSIMRLPHSTVFCVLRLLRSFFFILLLN